MNPCFKILGALLLCATALPAWAQVQPRVLPVPSTISPQLQELIAAPPPPFWNLHPKNAQEWQNFSQAFAEEAVKGLPELRQSLGVDMERTTMGGVPVLIFTPRNLPESHRDLTLLNLHGGGYVLGQGEAGTQEAVLMAGLGKFRVIYADYRMAPEFPFPAAVEDSLSVYRELLKQSPAAKTGVFGTSTGGGLTLILTMRAREAGLPLPGALAAGTPWTDLTKTGDSYRVHAGVDNVLVSHDGWVSEAAQIYAGDNDWKNPLLSPVYGDVQGFPPTLLTTGTRDLFLSNTVRMHMKLRQAGVAADLIVFEGMSHAQYHMLPSAPETIFHFEELARFFEKNLQ